MSSSPLRKILVAAAAGASSLFLAGGVAQASVAAPAETPQELPVCAALSPTPIHPVLVKAMACEAH